MKRQPRHSSCGQLPLLAVHVVLLVILTCQAAAQSRRELVAERRMQQTVYEVSSPSKDPISGKNCVTRHRAVEIGPGLNYDASGKPEAPDWRPTVAELMRSTDPEKPFECLSNPMQCRMPRVSTGTFDLLVPRGGLQIRLPEAGGSACEPESLGSVLYRGIHNGVDLRAVVGKGSFAVHGLYQTTDSLRSLLLDVETELEPRIDSALGNPVTVSGGLLFAERQGNILQDRAYLAAPMAFDAKHRVLKVSTVLTRTRGSYRIKYDVVREDLKDAEYPITLDPEVVIVDPSQQISQFQHGVTYAISGTQVISTPQLVTFEGGAIIKLRPLPPYLDSCLVFTGNVKDVRVAGEPGNYVYFTSAADDSIGVDLDCGGTDPKVPWSDSDTMPSFFDFHKAIQFDPMVAGCTYLVDHGKFRYGWWPLLCYAGQPNTVLAVCNSVFRDTAKDAVWYRGDVSAGGDGSLAFINNLVVNTQNDEDHGAIAFTPSPNGTSNLYVLNSTLDTYKSAIMINSTNAVRDLVIQNNIMMTRCPAAWAMVYSRATFSALSAVRAITRNGDPLNRDYDIVPNPPGAAPERLVSPAGFYANDNGSYYLGATSAFKNSAATPSYASFNIASQTSGFDTAKLFNPRLTTTSGPGTGSRAIEGNVTDSRVWSLIERDTDALDMGYHYDPVDYIVRGQIVNGQWLAPASITGATGQVIVRPGVTVAISDKLHNSAGVNCAGLNELGVNGGARIDVQGTGVRPVRFTSTLLTGDSVGNDDAVPEASAGPRIGRGPLYNAGLNLNTAQPCVLRFAEFCGAKFGGEWSSRSAARFRVEHCRFTDNETGFLSNRAGIDVHNCLFVGNFTTGLFVSCLNDDGIDPIIANCTFDKNATALFVNSNHFGNDGGSVSNCIFTNSNTLAVQGATGASNAAAITNNCFNGNAVNAASGTKINMAANLCADPKFVTSADPYFVANNRAYLNKYHLDQTVNPCVNGGTSGIPAYMSTSPDPEKLDWQTVDIGYHYPVKGSISVSKAGRYFVTEDNEPFIVLGTNTPWFHSPDWYGNPNYEGEGNSVFCYPLDSSFPSNPSSRKTQYESLITSLASSGINTFRQFFEYQGDYSGGYYYNTNAGREGHRLERQVVAADLGQDQLPSPESIDPNVERLNDELFQLARANGVYILGSPFDTYFIGLAGELANSRATHWDERFQYYYPEDGTGDLLADIYVYQTAHPYNRVHLDRNDVYCGREQLLHDDNFPWGTHNSDRPNLQQAVRNRWKYLIERYGNGGSALLGGNNPHLFGFDLFNELDIFLKEPEWVAQNQPAGDTYEYLKNLKVKVTRNGKPYSVPADTLEREKWFLCGGTFPNDPYPFEGMGQFVNNTFKAETGRSVLYSVSTEFLYAQGTGSRAWAIFDDLDPTRRMGSKWVDQHLYVPGNASTPITRVTRDCLSIIDGFDLYARSVLSQYDDRYEAGDPRRDCPPPLLCTEWGEIKNFNDVTDPNTGKPVDGSQVMGDPFRAVYYRHGIWAYLAAGGAGNIVWPYTLQARISDGMLRAAKTFSAYTKSCRIPFANFRPVNASENITVLNNGEVDHSFKLAGCSDGRDLLVYLARNDLTWSESPSTPYPSVPYKYLDANPYIVVVDAAPAITNELTVQVMGASGADFLAGAYRAEFWDPTDDSATGPFRIVDGLHANGNVLSIPLETTPESVFPAVASGAQNPRDDVFIHVSQCDPVSGQ